jgi:hypothetical protein
VVCLPSSQPKLIEVKNFVCAFIEWKYLD